MHGQRGLPHPGHPVDRRDDDGAGRGAEAVEVRGPAAEVGHIVGQGDGGRAGRGGVFR